MLFSWKTKKIMVKRTSYSRIWRSLYILWVIQCKMVVLVCVSDATKKLVFLYKLRKPKFVLAVRNTTLFGISKAIRWLSRTFSLVITKGGSWEPSEWKKRGLSPPNKNNKNKSYFSQIKKNGGCGGRSPPNKKIKEVLPEKVFTQLYNSLNLLVNIYTLYN